MLNRASERRIPLQGSTSDWCAQPRHDITLHAVYTEARGIPLHGTPPHTHIEMRYATCSWIHMVRGFTNTRSAALNDAVRRRKSVPGGAFLGYPRWSTANDDGVQEERPLAKPSLTSRLCFFQAHLQSRSSGVEMYRRFIKPQGWSRVIEKEDSLTN